MKKVSIVIPNFNRAKFIEKVIESAYNQTYKNIEIIVVDDCSTDNSKELLFNIREKYKNLKLFFLEENRGANYCRNYGVNMSTGDFIAFLDSDDYFFPYKMEVM